MGLLINSVINRNLWKVTFSKTRVFTRLISFNNLAQNVLFYFIEVFFKNVFSLKIYFLFNIFSEQFLLFTVVYSHSGIFSVCFNF